MNTDQLIAYATNNPTNFAELGGDDGYNIPIPAPGQRLAVVLMNQNTGRRHEFATEAAALLYAVDIYGVLPSNIELLQATGQADGLTLSIEAVADGPDFSMDVYFGDKFIPPPGADEVFTRLRIYPLYYESSGEYDKPEIYLLNAIPNALLVAGIQEEAEIIRLSKNEVETLLKCGFTSAVGHADTAARLTNELGRQVDVNRIDVTPTSGTVCVFAVTVTPKRAADGKLYTTDELNQFPMAYFAIKF